MLVTKLRHVAYTLVADVTAELHPGFERRLMEVADSMTRNLTLRARYQMEMIIRDYGTHIAYKVPSLNIITRLPFLRRVRLVPP